MRAEPRMVRALLLSLVALLAPAPAHGQWPGSVPEVCSVPTTFQVRPHSTCSDVPAPRPGGCAAPVASVSAQRGEVEDVQLLLRKGSDADDPGGGVRNVTVSLHGIPSSVTASVYRVGYVRAEHTPRYAGSGGVAQPVMPLQQDQVFSVPAGVAQPLWISLRVAAPPPRGTTQKDPFKFPMSWGTTPKAHP